LKLHPALKSFIEYIDCLIKAKEDEKSITEKVANRMKEIMSIEGLIHEAFKKPNPNKYILYPIYVAPDNSFSIASAVWDVGQSTPIHSHGTWGVIGIIQGGEHEIHYDVSS
ncbi:hypothetical protein V7149_13130, partial [Bacillus sp. JJ1503]|uniref:cysteine dioxygenase family protein n=1 Tax=Bacillus sp. JJ1503 TaxID=3122956 RepID=UPI002FFF0A22